MTITKVKPSSSEPIGVSFSYKCHKVRWAYRLKYVAARPIIVSMPYELIVLGLQSKSPSKIPEVIICVPTIKSDIDSRMLTNVAHSNGDAIIIMDNPISMGPATILNILDAL